MRSSRTAARRKSASSKATARSDRPSPSLAPSGYVLVVDDVADNRIIYTKYLEHHGLRVAEAVDGAEALARIAAELPDAVVMDLAMPILDGWEATRRIKSDVRSSKVVVVVLTGHIYGDTLRRAEAAGADAVLTKPCTPETLLDVVRQLLDR